MELNPPQDDELKKTKNLSLEEIKEKLKNMKDFLEYVKKDFPDYDVEQLACNLEDYSFLKGRIKDEDNNILATTTYNKVTYYIKKGMNNSKKRIKQTDYHEAFHVFVNNCEDIRNENIMIPDGINIKTPYYPSYYDNNKEDTICSKRYRYTVLEEIYAELYSSEATKTEQNSYHHYDEILNLIQITLGLNEDYQIDSILRDLLYKDPISFIKHFPVYGNNETEYFLDNLKMLKSFDILLKTPEWYIDKLEENNLDMKEMIINLKVMALSQISKTFFNNLIILNETHKEELSLQDNWYLLCEFSRYLLDVDRIINNIYNSKITKEEDILYGDIEKNSYYLDRKDFFKYLSRKYNLSKKYILDEYKKSSWVDFLYEDYKLPKLFKDKKDYYNDLFKNLQFSNNIPYNIVLRKVK